MKTFSIRGCVGVMCAGVLALAFAACQGPTTQPKVDTPKTGTPAVVTPVKPPTPAAAFEPIRIKAGLDAPLTDSKGLKWAAATDYVDGGSTIDRPDLNVTGTDKPELFRAEHYSMDSFHIKVPNGTYTLKLYFSEDYDGIPDANGRLFTYAVKDGTPAAGKLIKEVKNFGPWKASGAQFKAYIDTIPVTVTNGQISIVFTPEVENPQINAIEVLPG